MLQREVGFNAGLFPLLYVGTAGSYLLCAVPAGRLADRIGCRTAFLGGYLFLAAAYVVAMQSEPGVGAVALCLLLLGGHYALTDGVLMALTSGLLPPARRGTGFAVLCLNGHEWVKQQLRRQRIPFESLDNGFLTCADPAALQTTCDALGPADVQAFFDRWAARLPWPLTEADCAAGYTHRLALNQVEVSLTQVFDRPVQGRHFFEAVIRENLDLGRPDRVGLLFPLRLTRATPPPRFGYRTRVITEGVQPSLHIEYKTSHVKQYFKEQRALRTELTINNPRDFWVRKGLPNLPHLQQLGDQVNRKLLEVERVSQACVLTQDALDRLQRPTVEGGHRASALRFGDPRVMAVLQALTQFAHLPRGFRNRDLRPHVAALLGRSYSRSQMTYDLRRLRLKGLIHRIPRTHRYTTTTYGLKVAFFYSKLYLRILRPNWLALIPEPEALPRPLRVALNRLDLEIRKLHEEAALAA